ncbi:MAG: type ISP restriction/modification enzyme, partial [Candidatus Hodarchaeota archaeon]
MTPPNDTIDFSIITSSTELAINLARICVIIRENIGNLFRTENTEDFLHRIFHNVNQLYFNDLDLDSFSDILAQTITYGFFTLEASNPGTFVSYNNFKIVSTSIPLLKEFFDLIKRKNVVNNSKNYFNILCITELARILKNADMEKIFNNYSKNKFISKAKDNIIHFYEEFLSHYDPQKKIECGVFYTPNEIVSFMIKSIHFLLQLEFGCKDGLIEENYKRDKNEIPFNINFLDPAAGTGTFIVHIIDEAYRLFRLKYQSLDNELLQQNWNNFVTQGLLKQIFGFELLLTPYLIAHFKLRQKLHETGYQIRNDDQLGIFLTNTLMGFNGLDTFFNSNNSITESLTKQIAKANTIKYDQPVTIILGNPPYAGHSSTKSVWMNDLLHGKNMDDTPQSNYFELDGKPLGEKNPKWLNDDYVKFIRFAQWRIEKTGYGIVAFITNHSFLDNPTFRGMRQQLMESFNDIYVIDLHGNTRSKEKAPDGIKDENVFDIQQGVCISFFIKNPRKDGDTRIYRSDIWGLRDKKYEFLANNDISTIEWKEITAFSPWYMFYQLNMDPWNEYCKGWSITQIFSQYSVGIMTGLDKLTIQNSPNEIQEVVKDFILLTEYELRKKYRLPDDRRQWSYKKAKKDLIACGLSTNLDREQLINRIKKKIVPILYRPFDRRFTFYTGRSRGFHERPRGNIMKHMLRGENLGLIVSRNSKPNPWRDVQITEDIIELGVMASKPGNNAPLFPLYLYKLNDSKLKRTENFTKEFKKFIQIKLSSFNYLSSEKILYYIYAVLHS